MRRLLNKFELFLLSVNYYRIVVMFMLMLKHLVISDNFFFQYLFHEI